MKPHKPCPPPKNVQALRTPRVNPELSDLYQPAAKREAKLFCIQDGVTSGLTSMVDLMSATGQAAGDRRFFVVVVVVLWFFCCCCLFFLYTKKHFSVLSDATGMLTVVHKDLSQVPRESLRMTMNPKYRLLCNAKYYKDIESKEFLFGNEMSKRVEEM